MSVVRICKTPRKQSPSAASIQPRAVAVVTVGASIPTCLRVAVPPPFDRCMCLPPELQATERKYGVPSGGLNPWHYY